MLLLLFFVDKRIHISGICRLFISPVIGSVGIITVCLLCKLIDGLWFRTAVSVILSAIVYVLLQYIMRNDLFMEICTDIKLKIFGMRNIKGDR